MLGSFLLPTWVASGQDLLVSVHELLGSVSFSFFQINRFLLVDYLENSLASQQDQRSQWGMVASVIASEHLQIIILFCYKLDLFFKS